MAELWYIIAIGLLSLISTIISSKGSLFDKRHKWYRRLTARGKWVAFIGLCIIALSFFQFRFIHNRDERKDLLLKKEQDERDSVISTRITAGVDSSTNKLFNDLSHALADQNLRLDTVTKRLESIRDSAKTVIINAAKDSPRLIIQDDGIKLRQTTDTLYVTLNLLATQAEARLDFLDYICKIDYSDKQTSHTNRRRLLNGTINMPKGQPLNRELYVVSRKPIDTLTTILIGSYRSADNNKQINLLDVYVTIPKTNKTGFLIGEDKKQLLSTFGLSEK